MKQVDLLRNVVACSSLACYSSGGVGCFTRLCVIV